MKSGLLLIISIVLFFFSIVFSLEIGAVSIPLISVMVKLFHPGNDVYSIIIWQLRMPRILLAAIVGASLTVSGAVMQGLFRNPLADPYVTGTASGAALGATISMFFGFFYISIFFLPLFAFVGALLTTLIVLLISSISGSLKSENMLLAGIGTSIFLSAFVSLLLYLLGKDLLTVFYWLMGSFSGATWTEVYIMFFVAIPTIAIIGIMSLDLDPMMLGEDHAYSLGIDVKKVRVIFFILASLITGLSVAFSGIIGFVGLVIPHIVRILIGPKNRHLIASAIFIGASYMVIADTISRSISIIEELPVGIVTSMIGVPVFLFLLVRERNYWG
ncbi:MAG: iron ABC transporter permease [Thermoplasmata archaeon]|nr:iron chelate uptake ABC transporter family permease subunit [Euryarchaeota archaeon]MVT35770.1 iron chelate uptake ABC transporter family permease subunit [Euryarchaeota archaeon]